MIRITTRQRSFPTAPRPVILRVVRRDDPVVVPRRNTRRPAWSLLYLIVFLVFVALSASDFLLPEGLARSLVELLVAFGGIGLTRLWIGANRRSLPRTREVQPGAGESGANNLSEREVG
jgi:hypothetical protein